jgi:hypothetical protein
MSADKKNPGQFGNRSDTEAQARKGGQSQGKESNPGNFANRDEGDVRNAAKKGGQASRGNME